MFLESIRLTRCPWSSGRLSSQPLYEDPLAPRIVIRTLGHASRGRLTIRSNSANTPLTTP